MSSRESRRDRWWVDAGRQTFWATLRHPRRFWFGGDLGTLPPDMRDGLIAAQVDATRPAFTAIVGVGGLVLLLAGVLEAAGATSGIGYGAGLTIAAALGVIAIAVALWRLQQWPARLTLALLATATTGVFLSVPLPGIPVDVHARVGLFNLIPIGLLALLVRRLATWLLVAVILLVALLRVVMHGAPPGGPWLYWLYTAAIIAFSCVNVTETEHIFDIAQARVSEVIVGILCGGLMMMILPSLSDGETLLASLGKSQARLREHAQLLWLGEAEADVRGAHEGIIGQILTMNVLRIQAVWSHHRLRRQRPFRHTAQPFQPDQA